MEMDAEQELEVGEQVLYSLPISCSLIALF